MRGTHSTSDGCSARARAHRGTRPQAKRDARVLLGMDDAVLSLEVLPEFSVVVEPPQGDVRHEKEVGTPDSQIFEVSDRRRTVGRAWTGVGAVSLLGKVQGRPAFQ